MPCTTWTGVTADRFPKFLAQRPKTTDQNVCGE